jgi:hypothetical protein
MGEADEEQDEEPQGEHQQSEVALGGFAANPMSEEEGFGFSADDMEFEEPLLQQAPKEARSLASLSLRSRGKENAHLETPAAIPESTSAVEEDLYLNRRADDSFATSRTRGICPDPPRAD